MRAVGKINNAHEKKNGKLNKKKPISFHERRAFDGCHFLGYLDGLRSFHVGDRWARRGAQCGRSRFTTSRNFTIYLLAGCRLAKLLVSYQRKAIIDWAHPSNKERRLEVTFKKEIQMGEIIRLEFLKAEELLTNLGLFLSKYQHRKGNCLVWYKGSSAALLSTCKNENI